jgi:hypothetical protein
MRAAATAGFSLMVTCDQNIRYQQNMRLRPIGLFVLSTNHWETLRTASRAIVEAVEQVSPTGYVHVECGKPPKRVRDPL